MAGPLRIPLSWTQDQRQTSLAKDARRINVLDEYVGGQPRFVTKRSGITQQVTDMVGGFGRGLVYFNGVTYAVVDDAFKVAIGVVPFTGSDAIVWELQVATADLPWAPRADYGCVTLNDTIYVIAGSNATANNIPDVWSSTDGVNWRQNTAAAPFGARTGCRATVQNGTIFLAGGVTPTGTYLNDVWSSIDGTNWTLCTAAAAWTARTEFGMVTTSNGIFIMGGSDVTPDALNDVWFSTDGITWTEVTTPTPFTIRSRFAIAVMGNTIFVAGGWNDTASTYYNDVWSSPDGANWTQINAAAFGTARYGPSLLVYADKLWVLGGYDGVDFLSDVYSSPDGVTWTLVTAAPGWAGRDLMGAVVFRTPSTTSPNRYQTMWVLSGVGDSTPYDVWSATLDTKLADSTDLNPDQFLQPYQFASFATGTQLLIKNQSNLWIYGAGKITKVSDIGYPKETVPGIVVLGGFAYVMDPSGLIYNCALDDATYWPSLNVVGADYEDDLGVALVKYLNYIVAFGQYTIQFFYDAGLQFGSPLAPYLNANMPTGCADAASIAHAGNSVVWVSQTREGRKQVMAMNGFAPQPISNPFIEEFLDGEINYRGFSCTMKGQQIYVLTLPNSAITFAYSFATQQWYEFAQGFESEQGPTFDFDGYAYDLSFAQYLLQGTRVYLIDDAVFGDGGFPFQVYLRTDKFDAANKRRKFWGRLDIVGDENAGTPGISYTDDDYKTFSTPRTVDMNTTRPVLFRMGSSFRRAWVYSQLDSNPIRLEALEQEWEQGQ